MESEFSRQRLLPRVVLTVVVIGFELNWWDVAETGVQPDLVVPVDPVQCGELEVVNATQRVPKVGNFSKQVWGDSNERRQLGAKWPNLIVDAVNRWQVTAFFCRRRGLPGRRPIQTAKLLLPTQIRRAVKVVGSQLEQVQDSGDVAAH